MGPYIIIVGAWMLLFIAICTIVSHKLIGTKRQLKQLRETAIDNVKI